MLYSIANCTKNINLYVDSLKNSLAPQGFQYTLSSECRRLGQKATKSGAGRLWPEIDRRNPPRRGRLKLIKQKICNFERICSDRPQSGRGIYSIAKCNKNINLYVDSSKHFQGFSAGALPDYLSKRPRPR